ncbi:hypothetical protein GP486_005737 [Trichoglossum hirsutum]|uniref:DNA 3'-5' helicase n=1 Tax=Trichoglossum hirsutum TaxID=265104 RepID=A0A9P8L8L3_9PEZI|nr:hypothetical protein GP486_005737 [Trichoglossum hirsutum]
MAVSAANEPSSLEKPNQTDVDMLRNLGMVYHYKYGMFACLVCFTALYGGQLQPHLEQYHPRNNASSAEVQLLLARLPGVVHSHNGKGRKPWPTTTIPTLEGILVEYGYQCQYCNAAYRTDNSMKTHLRKKHEPHQQDQWRRKKLPTGPMQLFSSGNNMDGKLWRCPSFQVTVDDLDIQVPFKAGVVRKSVLEKEKNEVEEVLKERARSRREQAVASTNDPTAVDPWLMKMEWNRFLGQVPLSDWYGAATLIAPDRPRMDTQTETLRLEVRNIMAMAARKLHTLNRVNRITLNNSKGKDTGGGVRPIQSVELKTNHRYSDEWTRFILFALRTSGDATAKAKYNVKLNSRQEALVGKLRRTLTELGSVRDTLGNVSSTTLKRRREPLEDKLASMLQQDIINISYICLDDEIVNDPFRSPLVAFSAAAAVQMEVNGSIHSYSIMRPSSYTHILAAIRYCARMVVIEHSDRCSWLAFPDCEELRLRARMKQIQESCQRFMHDYSPSPLGELLCRLAYAFSASKLDVLHENVRWLDPGKLQLKPGIVEIPLLIASVQGYIQATEELLLRDLLFADSLYMLPTRQQVLELKDDTQTRAEDYWYSLEQQKCLGPSFDVVRTAIVNRPGNSDPYVTYRICGSEERNGHGTLNWSPRGRDLYETHCEDFLDRLMLLIHITSGQPARGREIMSIRWRNTSQLTQNVLGIALYRHVAVAISREKIQAPLAKEQTIHNNRLLIALGILDEDGGDYDVRDLVAGNDNCNEEMVLNSIFDMQTCHPSATSAFHYARGSRVWDDQSLRNQDNFRQASHAWHNLFGLRQMDLVTGHPDEAEQLQFDKTGPEVESTSGLVIKQFPWNEPLVTPPDLRDNIGWLMKDATAKFKSVEQARMFTAISRCWQQRQETVTTVMATGAGKTLPILLNAFLPGATSTVVITPFVSLMEDFEARCQEKEVTCERWTKRMSTRPKIIVIAAETIANSKEFFADLVRWTKLDNQLVDRTAPDEAHAPIAAFYRNLDALAHVLPAVPCQKVIVTATLPPSGERLLFGRLGISSTVMLRCPTARPNLCYRIEWVDQCYGVNDDGIPDNLLVSVMMKAREIAPDEKIIVYCRTKAETQLIAKALRCDYYNGDLSDERKREVLRQWLGSDRHKIVSATFGGLGNGIDGKVRYTFHASPWQNAMLYVQESGRAARDGHPGTCFVFCRRKLQRKRKSNRRHPPADDDDTVESLLPDQMESLTIAPQLSVELRRLRDANAAYLRSSSMEASVFGYLSRNFWMVGLSTASASEANCTVTASRRGYPVRRRPYCP